LAQARANFIDAELLGSLFPPLTAEEVRAVRCPVLLVGGDRSPAVFGHLTRLLHRLLPCAERIEIARASHLVHEDAPSAYSSAVLQFLGAVDALPEVDGGGRRNDMRPIG
jgi:pimeloyl-ACP methyl ester carboxylesterase